MIDTVGGETLERAFAVLRCGSRLVSLSTPPAAGKADEFGVRQPFSSSYPIATSSPSWPNWSTHRACRWRSPTPSRSLDDVTTSSNIHRSSFLQVLYGARKPLAPQFLSCSECLLRECDGRGMLHGAGPVPVVILLVDECVPMV